MKRNFQALVVLHQCLIFAAAVIQSVTDDWLPPEAKILLGVESSLLDGARDDAPWSLVIDIQWWAVILIGLSASAGVLLFRRWGRTLFVAASLISLALSPLSGLYVDVGWTVMVASAAGIAEGMIISLMFFSPLRKLFHNSGEI